MNIIGLFISAVKSMFRLESHIMTPESNLAHLSTLSAYRSIWLEYRARNERAGGLDGLLALEYRAINGHMNGLLEKYHTYLGGVAVDVA